MSAGAEGLYSVYENGWLVGAGSAWLERCPREHFPEADIRPACSTADAALGLHREALEPPRGAWLGEWQVEVTQDTDAQGWRYGASFAVFLTGGAGAGMGASAPSHNPFLPRAVRRRRWVRRYGAPGAAAAGGSPGVRSAAPVPAAAAAAAPTAAASASSPGAAAAARPAAAGAGRAPSPAPPAAARQPLPLSPPPAARADPAAALLEALRSGLPVRTGAEAEQLTPAAAAADLEALNKLLQVLRRAVGLVQRAAAGAPAVPPAAPQGLTSASLARGAQEMALRLRALEGICKARSSASGGGGGGGGGSGGSSAWLRLGGQCSSLLRQVADEVARVERAPPARAAAGGRGGSSASGSGSGGSSSNSSGSSSSAPSHAVTAAAAAAQLEAQQMLQAQAQMSEAEWALQDAEERERDILQIAREVSEVADMFKDLNALVVTQGEAIERIEERAGEAAEHAKKGVEEVREANRKHRHSQACAIA